MGIGNRKATCDVCSYMQEELSFGVGWPGWAIINGIGAQAPKPTQPIKSINMETYLCPKHSELVSNYINTLQEDYK